MLTSHDVVFQEPLKTQEDEDTNLSTVENQQVGIEDKINENGIGDNIQDVNENQAEDSTAEVECKVKTENVDATIEDSDAVVEGEEETMIEAKCEIKTEIVDINSTEDSKSKIEAKLVTDDSAAENLKEDTKMQLQDENLDGGCDAIQQNLNEQTEKIKELSPESTSPDSDKKFGIMNTESLLNTEEAQPDISSVQVSCELDSEQSKSVQKLSLPTHEDASIVNEPPKDIQVIKEKQMDPNTSCDKPYTTNLETTRVEAEKPSQTATITETVPLEKIGKDVKTTETKQELELEEEDVNLRSKHADTTARDEVTTMAPEEQTIPTKNMELPAKNKINAEKTPNNAEIQEQSLKSQLNEIIQEIDCQVAIEEVCAIFVSMFLQLLHKPEKILCIIHIFGK